MARATRSVDQGDDTMGAFKMKSALLAAAGGLFVTLSACNDAGFSTGGIGDLAQVNPFNPFECKIGTTTVKVRVLFMIDNSGSTNTTDPMKAIRVATLRKFIADYGTNANLTYNFGHFSGTTASMYNMATNLFQVGVADSPVGNSSQLTSGLNAYDKIDSSGNTPYQAAFDSLSATVTADEKAGNKQDYAVVFMSDGQPTDISGAANLNGLVTSLKTAAGANGSRLTLSTVYFGERNDNASISNLTSMAKAGGGQFVDTNANGGVVINDVITVPGNCL